MKRSRATVAIAELTLELWEREGVEPTEGGKDCRYPHRYPTVVVECPRMSLNVAESTVRDGMSEAKHGTHNAGVAGSSPAPAIQDNDLREARESLVPTAVPDAPRPRVSTVREAGFVEWCVFAVDAKGRPVVTRTIYAETRDEAQRYFGALRDDEQLSSRLALRETGPLIATEPTDKYGRKLHQSFRGQRQNAARESHQFPAFESRRMN